MTGSRSTAWAFLIGLIALGAGPPSKAGVYTDDMGKCLVRSSTDEDRTALGRWIFTALSANPAVKGLSKVTPADMDAANQRFMALVIRLTTRDCRKETLDALKYEGSSAFEGAFSILGETASRVLFSDPAVGKSMQGLNQGSEDPAMIALFKEAGIDVKTKADK